MERNGNSFSIKTTLKKAENSVLINMSMNISFKTSEMNFHFKKLPVENGVFAPRLDELLQVSRVVFVNTENQNMEEKIRIY